ncbi:hypothetical protein RB195_020299 [Necator americanus]|uniref:Uncharacterized protein n=1 Tax=Necator americanus TaxID=51031 RepID=A0ABR1CI72_NECAM
MLFSTLSDPSPNESNTQRERGIFRSNSPFRYAELLDIVDLKVHGSLGADRELTRDSRSPRAWNTDERMDSVRDLVVDREGSRRAR